MNLPEAELSFYYAAQAQLEPELRPVFAERVANILDAYAPFCEPGPGDVDRAIRAALVGLWTPPSFEVTKSTPRWHRSAPKFERVSKQAVAEG
jgi:hypothetical protein